MKDAASLRAELREVTAEQDALRRQFEQQAAPLGELDKLKDELISTASHELKAPLTSLRGFAQLLLRRVEHGELDRDALAEGLHVIDRQAATMTRLLDDLLDASRVRSGKLDIRPQPSDLRECIQAVLDGLSEPERRRVQLDVAGEQLTGCWESAKIQQVLANLVRNALKYSPGNAPICLRAQRRDGQIEVAVSDRGIGIAASDLSQLGQRFYRTQQALASGLPGTGLGLYIAQGIVEAHGGRLSAESTGPGQGSTFRFTLPASEEPVAASA